MTTMRVNTLRIPCQDLGRGADCYRAILEREPAFGSTEAGYIGFELDNVTVLLEHVEAGEFEAGRYLGFSLEVPDIAAYHTRLRELVRFAHEPQPQPWGGIMTHVTDDDGNTLSIVEIASRT